ncbi:MAG: AAA family ATPase, partial [Romboutsia sp.]
KVLRRLIENKNVSNLILFGPPGIGKTTIAQLVASASNKKLFKLNGTTASVKDIQEIAKTLDTLEGYMPENLKGRVYYTPGNNKYENAIKEYWEKIKK